MESGMCQADATKAFIMNAEVVEVGFFTDQDRADIKAFQTTGSEKEDFVFAITSKDILFANAKKNNKFFTLFKKTSPQKILNGIVKVDYLLLISKSSFRYTGIMDVFCDVVKEYKNNVVIVVINATKEDNRDFSVEKPTILLTTEMSTIEESSTEFVNEENFDHPKKLTVDISLSSQTSQLDPSRTILKTSVQVELPTDKQLLIHQAGSGTNQSQIGTLSSTCTDVIFSDNPNFPQGSTKAENKQRGAVFSMHSSTNEVSTSGSNLLAAYPGSSNSNTEDNISFTSENSTTPLLSSQMSKHFDSAFGAPETSKTPDAFEESIDSVRYHESSRTSDTDKTTSKTVASSSIADAFLNSQCKQKQSFDSNTKGVNSNFTLENSTTLSLSSQRSNHLDSAFGVPETVKIFDESTDSGKCHNSCGTLDTDKTLSNSSSTTAVFLTSECKQEYSFDSNIKHSNSPFASENSTNFLPSSQMSKHLDSPFDAPEITPSFDENTDSVKYHESCGTSQTFKSSLKPVASSPTEGIFLTSESNEKQSFDSIQRSQQSDSQSDAGSMLNMEYFSQLKCLNESVLKWMQLNFTKNTHIDFSVVFSEYEKYMDYVNVTYQSKRKATPSPLSAESSANLNSFIQPVQSGTTSSAFDISASEEFLPVLEDEEIYSKK